MIIRAKTLKGWLRSRFTRQEIKEISEHGVQAGWSGLIYYADTSALYQRFEDEVWSVLSELAEHYGSESPIEWLYEYCPDFRSAQCPAQMHATLVHVVVEHYAHELLAKK